MNYALKIMHLKFRIYSTFSSCRSSGVSEVQTLVLLSEEEQGFGVLSAVPELLLLEKVEFSYLCLSACKPTITAFSVFFRIYFTPIHLVYEPKCGDWQLFSRCKITPIVKIAECFCRRNTVFLRQKPFVSIIETQRFYHENITNLITNKQSYNKLKLLKFVLTRLVVIIYQKRASHQVTVR